MKRTTETVWTDDYGNALLKLKPNGTYSVVPAGATAEQLAELGEAIADALGRRLDSAGAAVCEEARAK
jgi:hypothetical protein